MSNSILNIIMFSKFKQWDVKSTFTRKIKSKYPIATLGKYITNENKKVKIGENPGEVFGILGISNDIGMFDAYEEKSEKINQPYIKVENGYIAYNPYRVNVGSIGIKKDNLKCEYISPAYVIFSCKELITSDFLFRLMKSDKFNIAIKENTTGSVRQTLSFNKLSNIDIPLPDISIQNELIGKYNELIRQADEAVKEAVDLENEIEIYLFEALGISVYTQQEKSENVLNFIRLEQLFKWGVENNLNSKSPTELFKSTIYKNVPITNFCEINPSTIYQKEVEQISFLPMECISDIYGEIIELRDGEKGKSKGYTRFQENDVLWAKITPCMQNGKSVIAKNLKNGYGYGSTEYHVFRAKEDKVIPEFLYCFLRTKAVRELAKVYFTGSAGQQRVGADFLEALTLPNIPIKSDDKSILTQQIIVDKIFDMKSKIKKLKQQAINLKRKAKKEFEEDIFDE